MPDQVTPLLLVLDPDQDFLERFESEAKKRSIKVVTHTFSNRTPVVLEDIVLKHYPDIVIVNLDQDSELEHGRPVLEIRKTPLALSPIILGTTSRDAMALKTRCYDYGIDDYLIRPFSAVDVWLRLGVLLRIRALQKQLDLATRKLSAANSQLSNSNRSLEVMTITDELTGLNNMRFMTQYLEKQYLLFSRYARPFSIMMIDLDHFKSVNDKNDHLVGSETIKLMGRIINEATRSSDIKARYGGDEYIIAMPETDPSASRIVAERIRKSIADQKVKGHLSDAFQVTASVGVASYTPQKHKSYRDLIRDADLSLYVAKKTGRNRVVHFEDEVMLSQKEVDYDESQSSVLGELKKIRDV
jgi:two-component system cell cycle response regulator